VDTQRTVAFLHAHPDDEAIFTGGTMAMLAEQGHRVVLLVATSGELGVPEDDVSDLALAREDETRTCCESLGVSDIVFLRFGDSGLNGENPAGFAHHAHTTATERIGRELVVFDEIDALVSYDDHGIYGHPDHIQVHHVARQVAHQLNISTVYESTVDREYLHFVETHVVVEAGLGERPVGRGLAASDLGMPSLLIDLAVDTRTVLEAKRSAMAAHASQLPADAPAFALGQQNFAAVYGYEWYLRTGPASAIDDLPCA
jgi:LmbE family N-acetylglucosaminyl deacetylase